MDIAWFVVPRESMWFYWFQCFVHLFMVVLVFTTTVLLHTGVVRLLGIAFTLVVASGLLLRFVLGSIPTRVSTPGPQP